MSGWASALAGGDDARLISSYGAPVAPAAPTSPLDGVKAAWDGYMHAQFDPSAASAGAENYLGVDMAGAREEAYRAAMFDRQAAIKRATGVDLPYNDTLAGEAPAAALDPRLASAREMLPQAHPISDADYEARVDQLRAQHPDAMAGVPNLAQLHAQVAARLNGISSAAAAASRRAPVSTALGGLGGMAVDPVNAAVAGLTGGASEGAPLVARGLIQAASWAGLTAAEAPVKMAEADTIGGPAYTAQDAASDIGMAAVTGPLFELGAAGLGKFAGHLAGIHSPGLLDTLRGRVGPEAADATRGALQVVDRAGRDAAAIGTLRDGADYDAAVTSLTNGDPPPLIEPAQDLSELFASDPVAQRQPGSTRASDADLVAQPQLASTAAPGVSLYDQADYRGRAIYAGSFDPRAVEAAPELFQYKAGGDAQGVTDRLKGVGSWDPTSSGKAVFWQDDTGRVLVADGHQRRGLALRLEQEGFDPKLDGYLFRSADGWTAPEVRTVAALKNIREGSGSILDAAKVFRDAPAAMADDSLPVSGDFIRQARGLARLSPEAFGAAINKVIPERYAAEIGLGAGDRPDLHEGMVRLLKEGAPANADEARAMVQESLLDDWLQREGTQADMFGGVAPESTTIARAKIKASVLRSLRTDERLFRLMVRHADAIEAGGNTLARDANEASVAVNGAALEIISKLSLRQGELGEAFAAAAREVSEGRPVARAAQGVLQRVKAAIESGERIDGVRLATFDPEAPSAAAQKLLEGFDQPGGEGARAQADPKPEEADLEHAEAEEAAAAHPGLFDDIERDDRAANAMERLRPCVPA